MYYLKKSNRLSQVKESFIIQNVTESICLDKLKKKIIHSVNYIAM